MIGLGLHDKYTHTFKVLTNFLVHNKSTVKIKGEIQKYLKTLERVSFLWMIATCPKVWESWENFFTLPPDLFPRTTGPWGRFHDLAHIPIVVWSRNISGIDSPKDQWSKTHFWGCEWLKTCEGTFHRAYSPWSLVVPVQSVPVCLYAVCLSLSISFTISFSFSIIDPTRVLQEIPSMDVRMSIKKRVQPSFALVGTSH